MNENHRIQDNLNYAGNENNRLIRPPCPVVHWEPNWPVPAGRTIIALTLDKERTERLCWKRVRKNPGTGSWAKGIIVEEFDNSAVLDRNSAAD